MRHDFLTRQRAWEAAQARNAPSSSEDVYYDDEEEARLPEAMELSSTQPPAPEDEVEDFLRDEDQELEALLEFMPEDGDMRDDGESFWSDDVDYEALFEQVLSQEEGHREQRGSLEERLQGNNDVGEEMDMS